MRATMSALWIFGGVCAFAVAACNGHEMSDPLIDDNGTDGTMLGHDGMVMDPAADGSIGHDGMDMVPPEDGSMDHGGMTMVPEVLAMPASEGPFSVALARDLDPAANVVEIHLDAQLANVTLAQGHPSVQMWTYNGQVPGPTIEAKVGDTVRVVLKNSLPEQTTIHWHGLRVPAAMDGVAAMQTPIAPGGEFTYEFVVPDAGTFWYHPHIRSDEQVERGLYGAIVVRDADEPTVTSESVVVLDDLLVGEDFQLAPFSAKEAMPGRQGNLIIINGRTHPIVDIAPGGLHRFRFVNVANARYFQLSLPGKKLIQIGTDGGFLEAPRESDSLLLVPGERADVLVESKHGDPGTLTWTALPYDRGHGTGGAPDTTLFDMRSKGPMVSVAPPVPATFAAIDMLGTPSTTRLLKLEESEGAGMAMDSGDGAATEGHGPVFSINGKAFPDGEVFTGELNTLEAWTVDNVTEMDHPFHLHGFRFQVDGDRAWRDTINIPARSMTTFRVRLEDHIGTWMFHCHILEHAERGMMGEIDVVGP